MNRLEHDIETECVYLAAMDGYRHLKADKLKRSAPDQWFMHPLPDTFIVEFKRPGQNPRKQQDDRIAALRKQGFSVHVIDNVPDFVRLLNDRREVRKALDSLISKI